MYMCSTASFVPIWSTTGIWFAISTALSCRMVLFAWLARVERELGDNYSNRETASGKFSAWNGQLPVTVLILKPGRPSYSCNMLQ